MKKQGHPQYQDVLFIDSSTGQKFVCGSTYQSQETETFEGNEYPVCRISISSASHPFFTGSKSVIDTEGRVDRFKNRYKTAVQKASAHKEAGEEQPKKKVQKKAAAKKKK